MITIRNVVLLWFVVSLLWIGGRCDFVSSHTNDEIENDFFLRFTLDNLLLLQRIYEGL
jgi:hypothetical protein